MTTYNTNNPVGSRDPRDLYDNAEVMDRMANDAGNFVTDRLGNQRLTLAGLTAAAQNGNPAVQAALNAMAQADRAESARDAAIVNVPGIYANETAGRAAVADGQTFRVQGSGDVAVFEYRRTSASASVLLAAYPSSSGVKTRFDQLNASMAADAPAIYDGAGPLYPIATDSTGRVLLGYDTSTERLTGRGIASDERISGIAKRELNGAQLADYVGSGPVYPIATDSTGRVVLGYDAANLQLVGSGMSGGGSVTPTDPGTIPPGLRPVSRALNHLLLYGQSLSVGAQGLPIISTSQPYSNVTFSGGPRAAGGDFSALKPLIEDNLPAPDGSNNRGETPCSGAANYATTLAALDGHAPADHVILASTAGRGGYRIDQLNKGSAWYSSQLLPHISGGKARNADYAVHAFGWVQGEQDAAATVQTPYAAYRAALKQLQADIEADAQSIGGQGSPVYCLTYQTSYGAQTWPDVALAQLDLAQREQRFVLTTPVYHLPHDADAVHLTAVGYKWLGAYFGRAYKRIVFDGKLPQWLNPVSATRRGTTVRVRFDVPALPLVLDTATLAATTTHGFRVIDGAGATVAISSISVDGSEIVIQLAAEPSGVAKVRYALDYRGTGINITDGASGNLRDSTPDSINISGVTRPLYHVCPHFQLPIYTLGE